MNKYEGFNVTFTSTSGKEIKRPLDNRFLDGVDGLGQWFGGDAPENSAPLVISAPNGDKMEFAFPATDDGNFSTDILDTEDKTALSWLRDEMKAFVNHPNRTRKATSKRKAAVAA